MKILIIEDNTNKFNSIVSYLEELEETDITRKKSINGGLLELRNNLDTLEENKYELLILDMQLPRYEDEPSAISSVGGLCVMREIIRKDWPISVVICSGDSVMLESVECPQLLGAIKYDCSVYLKPEFEKYLRKAENLKPEETFVNIYYSFDANAIKKFPNRKEALDYIDADVDDEVRIQTEENGKIPDVDFVLVKDVEKDEYAKLTFKNGDVIEWSIPNIL